MLIRIQNKEALINLNNINDIQIKSFNSDIAAYKDYQEITAYNSDIMIPLGYYSSKEKSIKVLDMIQECYTSSLYSDHSYDNAAQIVRPYIFVENKVFQMPKDEDVVI